MLFKLPWPSVCLLGLVFLQSRIALAYPAVADTDHKNINGSPNLTTLSTEVSLLPPSPYHQPYRTHPPYYHLNKRVLVHGLGLLSNQLIEVIQPAPVAARALANFYFQMRHNALFVWPAQFQSPYASHAFLIRYGAFECVLFAGGNEPIRWHFVAEFAHWMGVMTALGFVSTYRMVFANGLGIPGSQAISVSLMIMSAEAIVEGLREGTMGMVGKPMVLGQGGG